MVNGQIFLLIHGAGSVGNEWKNFQKNLEDLGNKVIVPNLRLHQVGGEASEDLGQVSIIDYVNDMEQIIEKLNQEPIIIGYSMGGLIALILCSRGFGKLGIFITPAAPSGINAITPSVLRIFIKNIFRWKFWSKPVPPNFSSAYYGVFHDLRREQAKEIFDRSASPESGRALCEMGFPFLDPYGATKVSEQSIRCPTLTIGAGRDRITPIQIARKLKKKLKSKTDLIEFPKFSHYVMEGTEFEKVFEQCLLWMKNKIDFLKEKK
jgi:pimeloyl-ACP methyl ester carboxylesterase